MGERAVTLLREHQANLGYWPTAYTAGLSYDAPKPEMNTFLTARLVDLLSPIASERDLDEVV